MVKEDIHADTLATITDVRPEAVPGKDRQKLLAVFAEFQQKPLILNSTNIKRLSNFFGTTDTSKWRGPVVIYVDPTVEFGGNVTGGIRLRQAGSNGVQAPVAQPPVSLAESNLGV